MRYILFFLVFISVFGCKTKNKQVTQNEVPQFSMLLPDSATYFNTSTFSAEKPIVIFLFGPYCVHSRDQMNQIIKDMGLLQNIQFCLVTPEPFDDMKRFYLNYKLKDYPNIKVGYDYDRFVQKYYKAEGFPMIAVYGKGGKLNKLYVNNVFGRQIWHSAEG